MEIRINFKEVIWDLLSQWKAVLIVSLVVMVIVTGAKYHKDSNAYKAAMSAKDAAQTEASADERISDILAALPEDEVETVEFLVNQNEWVETEKEYMNNSILMNTNPSNQRTLLLDYYIAMSDATESKMTALEYGYVGYLNNEKVINTVGQAISPNTDSKYIAELISVNSDNSGVQSGNYNLMTDSGSDGAMLGIRVVLPSDADAEAVEKAMTSALSDYTPVLSNKIGDHSVILIGSSEAYLFNKIAVDNRNDIMSAINNQQTNSKNMRNALSDGQKAALDSITAIKKEATDADKTQQEESVTELAKPEFSKKYAVLGFVLGAMLYAFMYVILLIIRGCVKYASDAEHYTQSRLLGEVYKKEARKGIRALFHSNLVNKYRYKGKLDSNLQIDKVTDTLAAICKHEKTKEVILFNMTGKSSDGVLEQILERVSAKGLYFNTLKIVDDIDEQNMLDSSYAVFATGPKTEVSTATKAATLCNAYDVSPIGCLFIGTI